MLVSYAQNFEDVMLWRALHAVPQGTYIDIGAQDPIADSVSRLFYDKGWRGIHVEATATYANRLRVARPDEVVIQAAVSDATGIMTFYEIPGTGISTGDATIAAAHRERGFDVAEVSVPTLLLDSILDFVGDREVHWLKIDVEGMEQKVLAGWRDNPLRPWIVVIESTLPMTQVESFAAWEDLITQKGYRLIYFDGLNRFYLSDAHPELAAYFTSGPNIFDGFSLSGQSSAPFTLFVDEQSRVEKASLVQELEDLRKRINDLIAEGELKRDEATHVFQERISELDRLAQARLVDLEWMREDAINREKQLDEAHQRREHIGRAKLEAARSELRRIELDWRQQEAGYLQTIGELQSKITDLQIQWRLREQDITLLLQQTHGNYNEQKAALNGQITELYGDLAQSNRQHAELQGQVRTFESQYTDALRVIDGLKNEKVSLQTNCDALSGQLAEALKVSENLRADSVALSSKMRLDAESHASCATALRDEIQVLKSQLQAETRLLRSLEDDLAEVHRRIGTIYASRSWRYTAIFRWLTGKLFRARPTHGAASAVVDGDAPVVSGIVDTKVVPQQDVAESNDADPKIFQKVIVDMTITGGDDAVTSCSDLLRLYDEAFVIAAYRILLKREPDPEGKAVYLSRVRAGDSKEELVWNMRNSAEGRRNNVSLPGLITRRAAWRRYASYVRRLWQKLTGQAAMQRHLRMMENQLGRNVLNVAHGTAVLTERVNRLSSASGTEFGSGLPAVAASRLGAGIEALLNRLEKQAHVERQAMNDDDHAAIDRMSNVTGNIYKKLRSQLKIETA